MKTFVLTKDGKIGVIYSDDLDIDGSIWVIPEEQWDDDFGNYDVEWIHCTRYYSDEIVVSDTNLSLIQNKRG